MGANLLFYLYFFLLIIVTAEGDVTKIVTATVASNEELFNFVESDSFFFEITYPEELQYSYKLKSAKNFGSQFERKYKNINMVIADPIECCSIPYNAMELRGAVALLSRGGCSFVSKSIKAEQSGAVAVIIMDSEASNDEQYITMIDDNTNRRVSIPVAFLLGRSGYMIQKVLQNRGETSAYINIPVNVTSVPIQKLNQPPWVIW